MQNPSCIINKFYIKSNICTLPASAITRWKCSDWLNTSCVWHITRLHTNWGNKLARWTDHESKAAIKLTQKSFFFCVICANWYYVFSFRFQKSIKKINKSLNIVGEVLKKHVGSSEVMYFFISLPADVPADGLLLSTWVHKTFKVSRLRARKTWTHISLFKNVQYLSCLSFYMM